MKKLIYGGLFLATVGILFIGCKKEIPQVNSSINSRNESKKISIDSTPSKKIIENATNYLKSLPQYKEKSIVLNLGGAVLITTNQGVVLAFSTNNSNDPSEKLGVYFNSNLEAVSSLKTSTKKISNQELIITYIDPSNDKKLSEIKINKQTGTSDIIFSLPAPSAIGPGQYTIDCINGYYSDHGWWSVGLWVGTLFDPLIGVAVAVGCATSAVLIA